jgi:hypothetical protein
VIQVRVVVEYTEEGATSPTLRWERIAKTNALMGAPAKDAPPGGEGAATFELLGRAFELAQREEDATFASALAAFFRGALIRKEDLGEVFLRMESEEQGT